MSPSAQLTSELLKEIIEVEMKIDQAAREVQEQVDCEEDLNPENTRSVLNTVVTGVLSPNNQYNTLLN